MPSTSLINIFTLFNGRNPNDFSFNEFKETFNQFFNVNDFANIRKDTVEEEYSTILQGKNDDCLNQKDLNRSLNFIVLSIADYLNNNDAVQTIIEANDVKIKSLAINREHFFQDENSTEIIVNFCVKDIDLKERESATYKRLYHATKKYLEENFVANKLDTVDIQPFLEMNESDFQKIIDSKLIEPVAIKHIKKQRKQFKTN